MGKDTMVDHTEENFCYECGNIITADRYFCDEQCVKAYAYRHREKDIIKQLSEQSIFRKKAGLPHHTTSSEETFPNSKMDGKDERKKNDELHHRLEIETFSDINKITGKYLEIIVLGWERNKKLECICNAYPNEICYHKGKIPIKPSPKNLECSILKVEVKNISSQLMCVRLDESQMIDTNGNIHRPENLCDYLQPRGWKSYTYDLYDGTHAKFYLIFPELEDDADIMRFIYRQSIFDAGATSGSVREQETFDFRLASSLE